MSAAPAAPLLDVADLHVDRGLAHPQGVSFTVPTTASRRSSAATASARPPPSRRRLAGAAHRPDRFAGRDITADPTHAIASLGIATCRRTGVFGATVAENLRLAERRARRPATNWSTTVPELAGRRPPGPSGGQQQMSPSAGCCSTRTGCSSWTNPPRACAARRGGGGRRGRPRRRGMPVLLVEQNLALVRRSRPGRRRGRRRVVHTGRSGPAGRRRTHGSCRVLTRPRPPAGRTA